MFYMKIEENPTLRDQVLLHRKAPSMLLATQHATGAYGSIQLSCNLRRLHAAHSTLAGLHNRLIHVASGRVYHANFIKPRKAGLDDVRSPLT